MPRRRKKVVKPYGRERKRTDTRMEIQVILKKYQRRGTFSQRSEKHQREKRDPALKGRFETS